MGKTEAIWFPSIIGPDFQHKGNFPKFISYYRRPDMDVGDGSAAGAEKIVRQVCSVCDVNAIRVRKLRLVHLVTIGGVPVGPSNRGIK